MTSGDDASWGTTTRALAEIAERSTATVPTLAPGTRLGERFLILRQLGAGGMGFVYRARDEKLSREVAIKVHARHSGAARLEREATAMAQLSHPNVVTVHEVGTHEGAVFIAMELVEGETARAWRARAPRAWREVVKLYLAAGQGLLALHRAGLVHRDFKPDNVLVGSDGRVRVADLGLARAPGTSTSASGGGESGSAATGIAGTPAYMAPEQRSGAPVDAKADQYSFAAALSEALRDLGPPRRIRRALARGCAVDPEARWPSLSALLDRLAYDPRPRLVALGVAVVMLGALGLAANFAQRRAPCRAGAERFLRAWSPAIRQAVHGALTTAGLPDAAAQVETVLDRYQRRWIEMYTTACEATRVHRDQSEDLLDRRMGCLESRLDETAALTSLFAHADGATAKRAPDAARAITPVDGCGDIAALTAIAPLPADPAARSGVEAVRKEIDETKALDRLARFTEAKAHYESALARARKLGFPQLVAYAAISLSETQASLGQIKEAEANARDAAYAAEAGRDDSVAAEAWVHLVFVVGVLATRWPEGHELSRMAEAKLQRLPTPNRELEAQLLDSQGAMLNREGKRQQAIALGEHALAIRRQLYGDNDQRVPQQMFNLGVSLMSQDGTRTKDIERALALFKEALAIDERLLSPDHPDNSHYHVGIAEALKYLGRFSEAEPEYARALAIAEKALGPKHETVAEILLAQAGNRNSLGDWRGAVAGDERALAIEKEAVGSEHFDVVVTELYLAQNLIELERFDEALRDSDHAIAVLSKREPDENLLSAYTWAGEAQLGLGRQKEAMASFARAIEIAQKHDQAPFVLASARFGLARALPSGESARAVALAKQARGQFAILPLHYHRERDAVDAWLATHAKQ